MFIHETTDEHETKTRSSNICSCHSFYASFSHISLVDPCDSSRTNANTICATVPFVSVLYFLLVFYNLHFACVRKRMTASFIVTLVRTVIWWHDDYMLRPVHCKWKQNKKKNERNEMRTQQFRFNQHIELDLRKRHSFFRHYELITYA